MKNKLSIALTLIVFTAVFAAKDIYDEAIEYYTATLRTKPNDYEALNYRGVAYAEKGSYDQAIEDYTAALKIKPDYSNALFNRGRAYAKKGSDDRAIEDYNAAIRIKPNDYDALYNRGNTYYRKGSYDQAFEDYTAAIKIKPDFYEALFNRGIIYFKKGNQYRAIEDWEAVLRFDPNNAGAKQNLEKLRQNSATPAASSLKDSRDNKAYKAVNIGNQVWMAENLNYNASGSKCYNNLESNCQKYGRLYNWDAAKKVCPSGWHLPSDAEWDILTNAVGGKKTAGKHLKSKSEWNNNGGGLDTYGFTALPGGGYDNNKFDYVGGQGAWWSSIERNSDKAYLYSIFFEDDDASVERSGFKNLMISVRCLKD